MNAKMIKKLITAVLVIAPLTAFAAGAELKLDRAPDKTRDLAALQNGAKLFVNYCLNCHGASYVRYSRLKELGLSEGQIKDNLLFTVEKVGEPMTISLQRKDAKQFFGAWPPDLSLVSRSRSSEFGTGADWLYTYLRGFYKDPSRPTGWNNTVFENVGMPHALWELQGVQALNADHKLSLQQAGKLTQTQYDSAVADLVSFLVWIGEPVADKRKQIGIIVIAFLTLLLASAYALKRQYWKDVH